MSRSSPSIVSTTYLPAAIEKAISAIQFDAQGLITEFEVMVRPLSGLQALGAEMGARLAAHLPAHKLKT